MRLSFPQLELLFIWPVYSKVVQTILSTEELVCLWALGALWMYDRSGTQCFHVGAGGEREKEQCQVKKKEQRREGNTCMLCHRVTGGHPDGHWPPGMDSLSLAWKCSLSLENRSLWPAGWAGGTTPTTVLALAMMKEGATAETLFKTKQQQKPNKALSWPISRPFSLHCD